MTKLLPLIIGVAVITGCATTKPDTVNTMAAAIQNTTAQPSSYALGLMHVKTLRDGQYPLDRQAYEQGLRDALDGKTTAQPHSQAEWQTLADLSLAEMKAANLAAGKAFLEKNKTREGVIQLENGVQYQVLKEGKGPHKPASNDTVGIMYTITGLDGTVKADTMVKGNQKMYQIPLQKITSKGWQEALMQMPQDSKWRLFIPGELAFGDKGLSEKSILPYETLVIDTHLLEITMESSN